MHREMDEHERITVYEVFLEDMLHVFQDRFAELDCDYSTLSEHDKGKWLAYWEILDIIRTRYGMIMDILQDN